MPKPFSEQERETIRQRLMDEGLKRFMRVGIRALRIDELCRDVGISKGSFYAFFPSKEALYFALANAHDDRHKTEMMAEISAANGDIRDILGLFFDSVLNRIETDPLVTLVKDSSELAYVMRHAPPNYIVENRKRDKEFVEEFSALLNERFGLAHADADTIEGLLTLAFTLGLQRENLEALDAYSPTVKILREMFVARLIQGSPND